MTRNCDPVEQQLRQDFLDDLYHRAGRGRQGHPLRGLYTGLFQEWTVESQPQEVGS